MRDLGCFDHQLFCEGLFLEYTVGVNERSSRLDLDRKELPACGRCESGVDASTSGLTASSLQ